MNLKKKALLAVAIVAVLIIFGTAVLLKLKAPPGGDSANSTTPLGGLFQRASAVSRLKEQMGDLREVYPAMTKFAQEHQDELPKSVAELKPYLPAKLAKLDDEHWELPSSGKMTPLISSSNANSGVLLQEKNTPLGKPKIVVYADGHIEYKSERK
jgi:hypothetical protein